MSRYPHVLQRFMIALSVALGTILFVSLLRNGSIQANTDGQQTIMITKEIVGTNVVRTGDVLDYKITVMKSVGTTAVVVSDTIPPETDFFTMTKLSPRDPLGHGGYDVGSRTVYYSGTVSAGTSGYPIVIEYQVRVSDSLFVGIPISNLNVLITNTAQVYEVSDLSHPVATSNEAVVAVKRPVVYLPLVSRPKPLLLLNGDFENGSPDGWQKHEAGGPLVITVTSSFPTGCFSGQYSVRLGTPGERNDIPVNEKVSIKQTTAIPVTTTDHLRFKYWMYSYDIITGSQTGRVFDSFDVTLNGNLVGRYGNPAGSTSGQTLWDSGCKAVDLPMNTYAGQKVTVELAVWNRLYPDLNTWAYIDDVTVGP